MERKIKGSISVFFALCYLLVMLTILGLVEGVRLKAQGVCLQTALTGATDCLFGNYCRELYEEYGLLFFDGGYGSDTLMPERINEEWRGYLSYYERGPEGIGLFPFDLSDSALTGLETAVDRNGEAFLEEICEYEKYEGALELYERAKKVFETLESPGLLPEHTSLTSMMNGEGVTELPDKSDNKILSPESNIFSVRTEKSLSRDALKRTRIKNALTSSDMIDRNEPEKSSDRGDDLGREDGSGRRDASDPEKTSSNYTMRDLFLDLSSNIVLLMTVDPGYWKVDATPVGIADSPAAYAPGSQTFEGFTGIENFYLQSRSYGNIEEQYKRLFFLNYMKKHFRSRTDVGPADSAVETSAGDVLPAYETEYILFGFQNDRKNYIAALETLAMIRGCCNVASLLADEERMEQIREFAKEIASGGTEAAVAGVEAEIVMIWSVTETFVDLRALIRNESVSVFKDHDTWKTDWTDLPDLVSTLALDGWNGLKEDLFGVKSAKLTDGNGHSSDNSAHLPEASSEKNALSSDGKKTYGELPDPDIIDLSEDDWKVVGEEELKEVSADGSKKRNLPDIRMNYEEYLFLAGMILDLSSMAYRMMALMQGHLSETAPGFRMEHMVYSMSFEAEVSFLPVFLPVSKSRTAFAVYKRKIRLTDRRNY